MALLVDESYLPATLTIPPMTDEEFAEFCAQHPDLFFEVTAEGDLLVMPPNYSLTSARHQEIQWQLQGWARTDSRGIVTESAGGFVLPNGARRSPDAAWTLKSRIRQLGPSAIDRFWHLSPDFVVEVRSPHDRLRILRDKMREWIANGAQLAWLIDPDARTIEIYRPNREPETVSAAEHLAGEGPVAGFVLELRRVWDPLAD